VTITVKPVCADNSGAGCAWYNTSPGNSSQQCHDGLHDYILCFSWSASDSSATNSLTYCTAGGGTYNNPTEGNGGSVPLNNWWNITFGYYGVGANQSAPTGTFNFTITCYDNGSHSGSASIAGCFDNTCTGGGGGNNGGGGGSTGGGGPPPPVPCIDQSTGYQPSCTCLYPPPGSVSGDGSACPGPPSGGGGGCGININRQLFLPDYALMGFLPLFGVIPCP